MSAENIVQRLRRLIAEAVNSRRFTSETAFLLETGLSSGYLGELEQRLAKNPQAGLTMSTVRKLADKLGVTVEEIVSGQRDDEPPYVDKYSERAWAIAAARNLKYSEAAIQIALREDPGHDPGRLWWFRRIEAEEERARPPADSGSHKI